ncbi:MAG: DUF721 domain-containing protein [Paracoccaceae bacterium]
MARKPLPPPSPTRRMRGFEAASGFIKDPIRAVGESRGFAVTRLLTQWAEIVGENLALCTRPVKIGYGREGIGATLTLLTTSAQAPVVQMELPRIKDRVNACYGYAAISRISLTQTAPTGFAEGQAAFTPAPRPEPAPDPAIRAAATETAAGVQDTTLRAALETLAQNVLSRRKP